jgi:hypothetical protein
MAEADLKVVFIVLSSQPNNLWPGAVLPRSAVHERDLRLQNIHTDEEQSIEVD